MNPESEEEQTTGIEESTTTEETPDTSSTVAPITIESIAQLDMTPPDEALPEPIPEPSQPDPSIAMARKRQIIATWNERLATVYPGCVVSLLGDDGRLARILVSHAASTAKAAEAVTWLMEREPMREWRFISTGPHGEDRWCALVTVTPF